MDLGGIDRVALVMSLAVRHIFDQALGLSELRADQLYNINIAHLVVTADIVDFPDAASAEDHIDRLAVVLDIEPVSDVQTLAVYGKRLVVQRVRDHQRDQLLRELIRAVVVGAAADGHRQPVSSVICEHQKICGRFRSAVRAAGMNRRLLCKEEVRPVERQIPVYFVCGDLMESLNSIFPAGVHKHCRPHDIGLEEDPGIFNGAVNVGLRGEVYHYVRLFLSKEAVNPLAVADIELHNSKLRIVHDRFQGGKVSRVSEAVHTDDPILRMFLEHIKDKIGTDKAGASCHNNIQCLFLL